MSKPLFIVGGKDYRTPEEKWLDRLVEEHENGEHDDYIQLSCPKCEDLVTEKEDSGE